jgi:heme-degrading monooxygenase HmoA
MTFVNITALSFPQGMEDVIEKRFAGRKRAVDGAEGFESFELLRPQSGGDRYFVVTRWDTREHFEAWNADRAAGPDTHAQDRKQGMSVEVLGFEVVQHEE